MPFQKKAFRITQKPRMFFFPVIGTSKAHRAVLNFVPSAWPHLLDGFVFQHVWCHPWPSAAHLWHGPGPGLGGAPGGHDHPVARGQGVCRVDQGVLPEVVPVVAVPLECSQRVRNESKILASGGGEGEGVTNNFYCSRILFQNIRCECLFCSTKRTGMWSRLVSLVNLSLTLNVAGVSEERFPGALSPFVLFLPHRVFFFGLECHDGTLYRQPTG